MTEYAIEPTEQLEQPEVAVEQPEVETVELPLKPKVIVFTSPTCGPCRSLKPLLIRAAEQREFTLEIVELSDATRPLFTERGIRNVPVTMLVEGKSNKEMLRVTGGMTEAYLNDHLDAWEL